MELPEIPGAPQARRPGVPAGAPARRHAEGPRGPIGQGLPRSRVHPPAHRGPRRISKLGSRKARANPRRVRAGPGTGTFIPSRAIISTGRGVGDRVASEDALQTRTCSCRCREATQTFMVQARFDPIVRWSDKYVEAIPNVRETSTQHLVTCQHNSIFLL